MQDQYNSLQREEARETHPFCADHGIGQSGSLSRRADSLDVRVDEQQR